MKYSIANPPMQCYMTQSTWYKEAKTVTPKGILIHSSGANNPTLKRYVQPDDNAPNRAQLLELIGKNLYNNDWNHIVRKAGVHAWIGKLNNGDVTSINVGPWNKEAWGCGPGTKGSCNQGWIQYEICEDGLTDSVYFNKVYTEAVELAAYLCKLYNFNPLGTVTHCGVTVPVILCHYDSYKLGLGECHSDVTHWFPKHGKNMDTFRQDVAKLLNSSNTQTPTPTINTTPNTNSSSTSFTPYLVKVSVTDLRIRSKAGTDGQIKGFIPVGTYTIVEEANGPGANKWGRLKSGAGWIALDFVKKVQ